MTANESMSDERLARLAADNEPVGDHLSGLTADEVAELVAEVKRWRDLADRSVDGLSADNEWDEIRQLREMLAAAREHAQTAHDQTAELGGYVVRLRSEVQSATTRAETAERELAEMRERVGGDLWRVRYQLGHRTEWTEPTRHEIEARTWLEDFHAHFPKWAASLWHGYNTHWQEVPDGQ